MPDFELEMQAAANGYKFVCGVDEAGRMMNDLYNDACRKISELPDFNGTGLISLLEDIQHRNK